MAIEFTPLELTEMKPKVAVIGVGGAGGNAVNNMMKSEVPGVDFIAANTDAQALAQSLATLKIQLGVEATEGLGAGSHPDVGRSAAEEAMHQIEDALAGCHMVFVTAGMGGGTGTGAAPVIAKIAKNKGILTVGVVTKPFHFEGTRRMKVAEDGIYELQPFVDTLIVIPNQNLFRIASKHTTFAEAFAMADEVLCSGVRGITDLMMQPGLINLDFADIRAIMRNMGTAMMGTGEATGEGRALEAAEIAISNPLLDEMSLASAKGVVINITGGPDLTLFEVDEAANHIRKEVDENANIIVGSAFRDELQGRMRVSIVATGVTYLKASSAKPEAVEDAEDAIARRLHFEPARAASAAVAAARAEPAYDNEAPALAREPVGIVDDFVMPEAEQPSLDEAESECAVEAEEQQAAPAYEMRERHGQPVSYFVRESQRQMVEESLEFAEEGEDEEPSLASEPEPEAKPSLFHRMARGIKGIFTSEAPALAREEPAMDEYEADAPVEAEDDNVLSLETRLEDQDAPAEAPAEPATAEDEEDDQLSIPEFLRRQA
jgi:cell division protein FtsZ